MGSSGDQRHAGDTSKRAKARLAIEANANNLSANLRSLYGLDPEEALKVVFGFLGEVNRCRGCCINIDIVYQHMKEDHPNEQ